MIAIRFIKSASGGTPEGRSSTRLASICFDTLGIDRAATGLSKVGKGVVVFLPKSPAALTHSRDGADQVRELARQGMDATAAWRWKQGDAFVLRRGPYVIAAGLDDRGR